MMVQAPEVTVSARLFKLSFPWPIQNTLSDNTRVMSDGTNVSSDDILLIIQIVFPPADYSNGLPPGRLFKSSFPRPIQNALSDNTSVVS